LSVQDVYDDSLRSQILAARQLRERFWADPHRPRYHLLPPEGFFNDANGCIYYNGRYHIFYLARVPVPSGRNEETTWREIWDHSSSHDLIHWVHHPPALRPKMDGSTPWGIYSGGAVKGAPQPTLIYHVPYQGTCVATSDDPELVEWTEHPANPVIPVDETQEYVVMDPCGWYADGTYYALVGNKHKRPGYEGDCTSLFTSQDLETWTYEGPFYQSSRHWTDEIEDCACPDFYPIGDKHMLLMHGHKPYGQVHYYLGELQGHRFIPQQHGRMNWPGGQISGPETMLDGRNRRVFFGWIREARDWRHYGWGSTMSLPRILSLDGAGQLRIEPAEELKQLRRPVQARDGVELSANETVTMAENADPCSEIDLEADITAASQFVLTVRQTPDGREETPIVICRETNTIRIDLERSTLDEAVRYPRDGVLRGDGDLVLAQEAPFALKEGESLHLQVFLDRSVLEVFVNGRQCLAQRIYPSRSDSVGLSVAAVGGQARLRRWRLWSMLPTNPW